MLDVMTCFWIHDKLLTTRRTFSHYDIFLTSWQTFYMVTDFDFMTNILTSWRVFDVITNLVTSWRTLSRHYVLNLFDDKPFDIMASLIRHAEPFEVMTNVLRQWWNFWHHVLTSWRVDHIMTNSWCDKLFDVITYVALIDVMTNILTPWNFLTTWRAFWHTFLPHD